MTDHPDTRDKPGLRAQWWGAMRGALIEDDPVAAARRARLAAAPPVAQAADSAAAPAAPMSTMAATLLAQVLAKVTAYTALTEKLVPLEAIVVDERTRYRAAYALVRGSRTVDQIVQAIDLQHLPVLEAEAARFAAQLEEKERQELGTRSQELQALTTGIDEAARRIATLREDTEIRIRAIEAAVVRDRERQSQLAREIEAKRQELAGVQRQFGAAVKAVVQALDAAKATVRRHLA